MKGKTRKISSLVVCLAMIATVFAVAGNVNAETGCVVPPSGMVSWWPGDGNADDIVGGLNGIPIDGVAFVLGKVDQAFAFNTANYVSVPDDPILTLGDRAFTIDLWVNFNRIQGHDPFIGHDESGGEYNKWLFWYDARGHEKPSGPALRFHINSPTLPPLDPVIAPWNPTIGQWYHVAVTRSDYTYALYIDGVQVATGTDVNTIPDPNVPLTIGKAESFFFDGLIDEVEIFNRALSTSEIQAIFNAGSNTIRGVPLDDFNDNTINPALWVTRVSGSGPTVAETNQRVEITFPADSSGVAGVEIQAGYDSVCELRGDFDIQVDYELLVWPNANGVRVGLLTGGEAAERVSFGSSSDFPGYPREVYLTHFADGVQGITTTNDLSGKLRLVRTGSMLTGYYFNSGSGNWIAIHSATTTTADTPFSIAAWSGDDIFTDQEVKIAFDNFVVNRGELICPGTTGVPLDDFNDNTINPALWVTHVVGSGPTVAETNQRVEITFPADSSGVAGVEIQAGYDSVCELRGDFDIQVDYELLVWPNANGVRVGLLSDLEVALSELPDLEVVVRVSFGSSNDFPGYPREVYLTHFADGVQGITTTNDLSGKLRLVRTGSMLTGYYFNSGSGNWIAIHSATTTTADTPFSIAAWSGDDIFTDQEVKIAFDNFVVNRGELICPGTTTPPPAPTPAAFQITNVNHPSSVICGGDAGDLEVWWDGNPTFPVTMIYRPKPGWGCPQGGCTVAENTFHKRENPLVFKGALWCRGYKETNFFNYEVLLRDAEDIETHAIPVVVNCIVM